MGYNLGGPAPDDVAVAPRTDRKTKHLRKKMVRKIIGRLNLGRENN
jgi:hypothetical protein